MWPLHSQWPSEQISFITTTCLPILQLWYGLFFLGKTAHHPGLSAPLQPRFGPLWLLAFPKAKIAVEREEICECDGHTVHKLSQRRLTADWLAPQETDCSRTHSKVSSDRLPSYITATWPLLEIFLMAGYFPDSPRIRVCTENKKAGSAMQFCMICFSYIYVSSLAGGRVCSIHLLVYIT